MPTCNITTTRVAVSSGAQTLLAANANRVRLTVQPVGGTAKIVFGSDTPSATVWQLIADGGTFTWDMSCGIDQRIVKVYASGSYSVDVAEGSSG